MDEGLTIRDVYLLLRAARRTLVAVPLLCAAAAAGLSLAVPKTFVCVAGVSLAVSPQAGASPWLSNLPSAPALAESLVRRPEAAEPSRLEWRYDEHKALLTLIVRARTAAGSRALADDALRSAEAWVRESLLAAATSNLRAASAEARLDVAAAESGLTGVRALRDAPRARRPAAAAPSSDRVAALEAAGVDPRVAAAPEAAAAFYSVEAARLEANLAQARARAAQAEAVLADPATLARLVDAALQWQVLTPAAEPSAPRSPRPVLYAGLAAFFGLVGALAAVFLKEAIARPGSGPSERTRVS